MIADLFLALSAIGCCYLALSIILIGRKRNEAFGRSAEAAVTILKPLHGDEPMLWPDLDSLCRQHYAGPVQIICGVQDPQDKAIAVVERLRKERPGADISLVIDGTDHGQNHKISNLINMMRVAKHEVLVLADSDIGVTWSYLADITAPLSDPSVGGVTCLYSGASVAGLWGRLSALAINSHFLPNVLTALGLRFAKPCFGSTIVLTRTCLSKIGGFESFADALADDYAIGAAIRNLGLRVAIPEMLVTHHCSELSLRELWDHEIRWGRTILTVDPLGYAGSLITHPLGWAVVATLTGQFTLGLLACAVAIFLRTAMIFTIERRFRVTLGTYGLVPGRDLLSFAVYVSTFVGRKLAWRGRTYTVNARGRLTTD